MAKVVFKPATPEQHANRQVPRIQEWIRKFEQARRGTVTRTPDGSFDVRGSLNLSKDKLFVEWNPENPQTYRAYLSLIQRNVKFNKIIGNFTVGAAELFFVLPRIVTGDIRIVGSLRESIKMAGCEVNGKVTVTLDC